MFQELLTAIQLLVTFDPELWGIIGVTLRVAVTSTALAAIIALPVGIWFGLTDFPGRRWLDAGLNAMLALPTVAVGLLVYLALSRHGPLGGLELLFTPTAIILGQIILALPVIAIMVSNAVRGADPRILPTALSLGATTGQSHRLLMRETKGLILLSVAAGFGRVVAEIGSAMLVGGNIRGKTRTLTTAVSLMTSQGEFARAMALVIVLMVIVLGINLLLYRATHRGRA